MKQIFQANGGKLPKTASDAGKTPRIGGAIGADVANFGRCPECEGRGYQTSCGYYNSGCIDCNGSGFKAAKPCSCGHTQRNHAGICMNCGIDEEFHHD